MKELATDSVRATYSVLDHERKLHNFELFGLDGDRGWWDNPYDHWLQENKIFLFMSEMSNNSKWSYRFLSKKSAVLFKLTWG